MKKVVVLSLGGSLIIPDKVNERYLKEFRKVVLRNKSRYKFIVVTGGGSVARKYISALGDKSVKMQSLAGIAATRMNARFMSYYFNQEPTRGIPHTMREVRRQIRKNDVIFCGALEYNPNQTSDSTAATIARKFRCEFVNLTDVAGLHDKNPKKFKNAKFIPEITWKEFSKMANSIKFKPGQHFVLDQSAAKIIMKSKIKTYILGEKMENLDNLLKEKKFRGSVIFG